MTNEELKKKIIEVLKDNTREAFSINGKSVSCYDIFAMQEAKINAIADALIAAGLKFDVSYSFTAAFNSVQAERECDLERRLTAAEHRAEVAERAQKVAADLGELCAPVEDYINQAEKELTKERKE